MCWRGAATGAGAGAPAAAKASGGGGKKLARVSVAQSRLSTPRGGGATCSGEDAAASSADTGGA